MAINPKRPIVNVVNGISVRGSPTDGQILQYNDTDKVLEWIDSSSGNGMSSEQFYQDKITSGNSFEVSGDISVSNDSIEYIVPNGKTAFLIEAKISPTSIAVIVANAFNNSSSIADQVIADLRINAIRKDRVGIGGVANAWGGSGTSVSGSGARNLTPSSEFNVKMLSLIGDGVKKIEIVNVLDDGSAFAQMSGYIIDT